METTAQKIARLKALREARDGTPEQIATRRKVQAAVKNAAIAARNDVILRRAVGAFCRQVGGDVPQNVRDFINGK